MSTTVRHARPNASLFARLASKFRGHDPLPAPPGGAPAVNWLTAPATELAEPAKAASTSPSDFGGGFDAAYSAATGRNGTAPGIRAPGDRTPDWDAASQEGTGAAERELLMRTPPPGDPFPAVTPGSGLTTEDFRRPAAQEAAPDPAETASRPDDPTALFTPDFAVTAPEDRQRPYSPESGPDPTLLPVTLLRTVPRDDSDDGGEKEILTGWPESAGTGVTETGQGVGRLRVGSDDDVHLHLEGPSREYFGRLAFEAIRTQLDGTQGTERRRLLDEHIARLARMREAQVCGGFRAAPAGPVPAAQADTPAASAEVVEHAQFPAPEVPAEAVTAAGGAPVVTA